MSIKDVDTDELESREANASIDSALGQFTTANADNPEAITATQAAAAKVRMHPEKYINPDGSVNKEAITELIIQKFAGVSTVTVPSPKTVQHRVITRQSKGITHSNLGGFADADIMALCFIVMMEAAKSAREDLKNIMDGVKAINKEKEGWRQVAKTIHTLAAKCAGKNEDYPISGDLEKDIAIAQETVKIKLDSLSEIGQTELLRMQMVMDRMTKMEQAVSNLLKMLSDTTLAIIQNMK